MTNSRHAQEGGPSAQHGQRQALIQGWEAAVATGQWQEPEADPGPPLRWPV